MEKSLASETVKNIPSVSQMFDLSGKVAVVAGGTYGLGYNVVYRYLECGANVVMSGRNAVKGEQSIAEFREMGFGEDRLAFRASDESKVDDCYDLIAFTEKTYGKVDILANIVGLQAMSFFLDITEAEYDTMYDTNVKSHFFLSQAAAKSMIRNNIKGYIIGCGSVGSLGADYGGCMMSHYSSSKAALNGLSIALGRELHQYGIHYNNIAAGCMTTEGQQAISGPTYAKYGALMAKMGEADWKNPPRSDTPDFMARMFLVMSTPLAEFVLGETIAVDGGGRFFSNVPENVDFSLFVQSLKGE